MYAYARNWSTKEVRTVSILRSISHLIEREMKFWGRPVISMLIGLTPIILLEPVFEGPPSAAPAPYLYLALGLTAIFEAFVFWLSIKFEIQKWRDLRALDKAERSAKNKR